MYSFAGKVCMITGAASGLGKALAIVLYERGCHLALLDKDLSALGKLETLLPVTEHQKVTTHLADITDPASLRTAVVAIWAIYDHVDILINNAGISISMPFAGMQPEDHRKLFEVNYWGMVHTTRHMMASLQKRPEGRLVNIISGFALTGFPGKTAYAASKAAIMAFTAALRTEPAYASVKISLVIPPPLATNIVHNGIHISAEKQQAENAFLQRNGMALDKAAKKIVRGIQKGKYRIVVGHTMFWADLAARLFPSLTNRFIGRKRFPFV